MEIWTRALKDPLAILVSTMYCTYICTMCRWALSAKPETSPASYSLTRFQEISSRKHFIGLGYSLKLRKGLTSFHSRYTNARPFHLKFLRPVRASLGTPPAANPTCIRPASRVQQWKLRIQRIIGKWSPSCQACHSRPSLT